MLDTVWADIAWPLTLLLAWLCGELGYRWLALPRISAYALVGVLLALGFRLSRYMFEVEDVWALSLIPQMGFGLILFELGYRINFDWLRSNRWIEITSGIEASATFAVVYYLGTLFRLETLPALLLASLAMATSPMTLLPVINDLRSGGQVTERTLHLSALNCVFAIVAFNTVVGYSVMQAAGSALYAIWNSCAVLGISAALGIVFGIAVPRILRLTASGDRHATVAYALAVASLIMVTHTLHFSPILATLTFGMVARRHRDVHHQTEPNFGVLGDLLVIALFVHIGTRFDPTQILSDLLLAVALIGARCLTKGVSILLFSRLSGLSLKKGFLTGLALTPMATFGILLLELSARRGLEFPDTFATMTGVLLLVDIASPLLTRFILVRAGEALPEKEA